VFGKDHGKWIGFDTIEYFTTELEARGPSLRVSNAAPSEREGLRRAGDEDKLGVMRLAASVRVGADERTTAGWITSDAEEAFRYTFRRGDGFLGWLTSFYNVPYLFGSAGKGARAGEALPGRRLRRCAGGGAAPCRPPRSRVHQRLGSGRKARSPVVGAVSAYARRELRWTARGRCSRPEPVPTSPPG
jgi:hypothetical protein